MAWRNQRKQRQRKKVQGREGANAVRSSPWASSNVKKNDFLDVTDLRVQLAQLGHDAKQRKQETVKQTSWNNRKSNRRVRRTHPQQNEERNTPEQLKYHYQNEQEQLKQRRVESENSSQDGEDQAIQEDFVGSSRARVDLEGGASRYDGEEPQKSRRSKKRRRGRPNYFACVRINDRQIKSELVRVQQDLISRAPQLETCIIDPEAFHVTLMMLSIENPFELEKVKEAMEKAWRLANEKVLFRQSLQFMLEGLSAFDERVFYASISYGSGILGAIREELLKHVTNIGCQETIADCDKPFTAHMTLAKVSRDKSQGLESNGPNKVSIEESFWEGACEHRFGLERCKKLYLCPVGSQKPGSFYSVEAEWTLDELSEKREKQKSSLTQKITCCDGHEKVSEKHLRETLRKAVQQQNGKRTARIRRRALMDKS